MSLVLTEGSWPKVSLKIKHLSHLIQKCAERLSSQAQRRMELINFEQPARDLNAASNVTMVESLLLHTSLPHQLFSINTSLLDPDLYVRLDVNPCMEFFVGWQRFVVLSRSFADSENTCVNIYDGIQIYADAFATYLYVLSCYVYKFLATLIKDMRKLFQIFSWKPGGGRAGEVFHFVWRVLLDKL
jgi:hypothetical protein